MIFSFRALATCALISAAVLDPTYTLSAQAAVSTEPTHLDGLTQDEADTVIRFVSQAQARLRTGERLTFELVSGAPAFYDMNDVAPREAFLGADFSQPFSIRKIPSNNRLWQPYEVILTPNGTGQLLWEVTIVLGSGERLERVEMFYRLPHPF